MIEVKSVQRFADRINYHLFDQQMRMRDKNIEQIVSENLFLKYINHSLQSRNTAALRKIELLCYELEKMRERVEEGNGFQYPTVDARCTKCQQKDQIIAEFCLKIDQFYGRPPQTQKGFEATRALSRQVNQRKHTQQTSIDLSASPPTYAEEPSLHCLQSIPSECRTINDTFRSIDTLEDSFYSLESTPLEQRPEKRHQKFDNESPRKQRTVRSNLMESADELSPGPGSLQRLCKQNTQVPFSNFYKYPTYHPCKNTKSRNSLQSPAELTLKPSLPFEPSFQADEKHKQIVESIQIEDCLFTRKSPCHKKQKPSFRFNTQPSAPDSDFIDLQATARNRRRKIFPNNKLAEKHAIKQKLHHCLSLNSQVSLCKQPSSPPMPASSCNQSSGFNGQTKRLYDKIWSPEEISGMSHGIFNNGRLIQAISIKNHEV